ncbi:MAG: hypothetical protein M3Z04_21385, partial [Chloroflexota bacterium]|nr:hypothetical protein [Chloroflexota bacterium]
MDDQTNQPPQHGHHHHRDAQQGTDQSGQPGYTPTGSAGSDPSGGQPSYTWQDPQAGMGAAAAGGSAPQGDRSRVSFNINDPQERQRIMQQLQDYQNGNTQRLPHTDLGHMANSWADQATPQH